MPRRHLLVAGMAAACAACTSAPQEAARPKAESKRATPPPPPDFDLRVRWAVSTDAARYRLIWFYSTLRRQTMRLVAKVGSQQETIDLVVNSDGTLIEHDGWNRATGAQLVNGRPTFWINRDSNLPFPSGIILPCIQMDWEYAEGGWASLTLSRRDGRPPVADVVSAAAKVRFGGERVKLPLWFTEPPPGMRVVYARLAPPNPSKPTLEASLTLTGDEHDGRLGVGVRTAQADGPSGREGYTTIDGHPAMRTVQGTDGYLEQLSVWGVNGLVVSVEVYAPRWAREKFAPDGAVGIFRRLAATTDETRWR